MEAALVGEVSALVFYDIFLLLLFNLLAFAFLLVDGDALNIFVVIFLNQKQIIVDVVLLVLHSIESILDVFAALTLIPVFILSVLSSCLVDDPIQIIIVVVAAVSFVCLAQLVNFSQGSSLFILLGVKA